MKIVTCETTQVKSLRKLKKSDKPLCILVKINLTCTLYIVDVLI